ncbi:MAG: hypothetical protein Q9M20_07640 [Mariprofundaceae bacterium]|nr:hypothetical protein [Mariprofundaceae bacterium]
MKNFAKLSLLSVFVGIFFHVATVQARESAAQVYQVSIELAAHGKRSEAIVALQAASGVLAKEAIWRTRMLAAAQLLSMQQKQLTQLPILENNAHLTLAANYIKNHPQPEAAKVWIVGLLAAIFPGAGHAWQGRWNDAAVAALFVWPLLILTLWAARRKMGPVTVFFALLTVWLWSGTVFSAISLMERGNFEWYMQWWQGLWQASALPNRPW